MVITYTLEYIYSYRSNIAGSIDSVMVDIINSDTIKSYTAFKVSHNRNSLMFRSVELTDEQILKKINGLLNKITKTNFNKIFDKIDAILKSEEIIDKMMDKLFDKAIKQTNFCELYAEICAKFVTNKKEANLAKSMKDSLLQKCQKMYIECIKEDEQEKGNLKNYDIFCKYIKRKEKLVGIFQFLGNLCKKNLCEMKDISNYAELLMNKIKEISLINCDDKEEEKQQKELLENLCECFHKLLKTLNESISLFKSVYYNDILSFSKDKTKFSARVRFMFLDLTEFFHKYDEKSVKSFSNNNNKFHNGNRRQWKTNDDRFRKGFKGSKYDKRKKGGRRYSKKYFDKRKDNNKDTTKVDNNKERPVDKKSGNSFSNRNRNRNRNNNYNNNDGGNYRKRRDFRKSGNKDNNYGSSRNEDNNYGSSRNRDYKKKKNYQKKSYSNNNSYSQNSNVDDEENKKQNKYHKNKRFEVLNSKD